MYGYFALNYDLIIVIKGAHLKIKKTQFFLSEYKFVICYSIYIQCEGLYVYSLGLNFSLYDTYWEVGKKDKGSLHRACRAP